MTTKIHAFILASTMLCVYQPLRANMDIVFVESAPKDWFSLTNSSECLVETLTMTIDLSNTIGKLVFDTTSAGQGVEVFQPFERREGDIQLTSAETVLDGENRIAVLIQKLAPGESVSFTIDVDDTLPESELGNIRVSDTEISGGIVSLSFKNMYDFTGTFDGNAKVRLPSPECKVPQASE